MINIFLNVMLGLFNVLAAYSMIRYFIIPLISCIKETIEVCIKRYTVKEKQAANEPERIYKYAYMINYLLSA